MLLPSASAVVVSEVFYDAVGSDTGKEFVELYNPAGAAVNITGWELERGNGVDPGDWQTEAVLEGVIPAFGFYLVGEANVSGADLVADLDLQNGPDAVRILNGQGQVRDLVGYGQNFSSPEFFEGSPAVDVQEGHSLERRPGYLSPLAGNGQDTENNLADFLDRSQPEPQNSSMAEQGTALVSRLLSPQQPTYLPNTLVTVTLSYSFSSPQVGMIVREQNPLGVGSPNPVPQYYNQPSGLAKWLLRDHAAVAGGQISYTFTTPQAAGAYAISGGWDAVDLAGALSSGSSGNASLIVAENLLEGVVQDVLGSPLEGALVELEGASAATGPGGAYSLPLPPAGQHTINASKSGFIEESEQVTVPPAVFNFTGDASLVPVQVTDRGMLLAVARWANDLFGDDKLLEVVFQWANT